MGGPGPFPRWIMCMFSLNSLGSASDTHRNGPQRAGRTACRRVRRAQFLPRYLSMLAGGTNSNGTHRFDGTGWPRMSFRAASTAPRPCPMASWNTVTFNSPAFIAASASCGASMPAAPTLSSLGGDYFYGVAWRLGDHILDILRALDGRLVRQVADHHRHAALAAEQPADLAGLQGARVGLVGADEHHLGWQLALGRRMVHIHQRDAGGAGQLGHPRGRLGVYGDDDDGVDLLGNEVL